MQPPQSLRLAERGAFDKPKVGRRLTFQVDAREVLPMRTSWELIFRAGERLWSILETGRRLTFQRASPKLANVGEVDTDQDENRAVDASPAIA